MKKITVDLDSGYELKIWVNHSGHTMIEVVNTDTGSCRAMSVQTFMNKN